MDEHTRKKLREQNRALDQIVKSDLSDAEKLKQCFYWITNKIVQDGEAEIELQRALGDQEATVKEQVKVSTVRYAQGVFDHCYYLAVENAGSRKQIKP